MTPKTRRMKRLPEKNKNFFLIKKQEKKRYYLWNLRWAISTTKPLL